MQIKYFFKDWANYGSIRAIGPHDSPTMTPLLAVSMQKNRAIASPGDV